MSGAGRFRLPGVRPSPVAFGGAVFRIKLKDGSFPEFLTSETFEALEGLFRGSG